MLSEIFSKWEIEDKSEEEIHFCKAEDYKPLLHTKNWFLEDNRSETTSHKAYNAYHCGNFAIAFELFNKMLHHEEHNRVHKVGIYESIIRSALKMKPFPADVESILHEYKQITSEYGEQLQYWNSAALVLQNFPLRTSEYMNTVVMLCSTIDSPEYWRLFGSNQNIQKGPNYELAYKTRILALLEYNLDFAAGFVVDRLQLETKEAKNNLDLLKESDERKAQAKMEMVTDLMRADKLKELGSEIKRPAHDCRCKIGVFKTAKQCQSIIKEFRDRYNWMFSGMDF